MNMVFQKRKLMNLVWIQLHGQKHESEQTNAVEIHLPTVLCISMWRHDLENLPDDMAISSRLLCRQYFWAPKSLQMVTAAMELKDAYSLEEKL